MEMTAPGPGDTVREGRDRYIAENGFSLDAYTAPTVTIEPFSGRRLTFPNTKNRQKAIPLHDLHHVATGYGTDLVGEAEIGAWELRGGCNTVVLYFLNGSAVLLGLLLAPRRVIRAFRRARGQRTLYRDGTPYEDFLELRVGELRARLGVPEHGQADRPGRLHPGAPTAQPQPKPATGCGT